MNDVSRKKTVGVASFCCKLAIANIIAIAATSLVICFYYNKSSTLISLNGRPFDHHRPYSHYCIADEGYCNGVLDFNGFNNLYCVEKNVQIMPPEQTNKRLVHSLLLGSSEMYGVHVPMNKTCCYLINKKYESDDQFLLYNIGASGNALINIAATYSEALDYFQPRRYAIIETRDLPQYSDLKNFETFKGALLNHFENKLAVFVSEHILSLRWIILNLQQGLRGRQNREDIETNQKESWNDENVDRLRKFLGRFSELSRVRDVQPILFYHPRFTLNTDGSASLDSNPKDVELYRIECEKQGIVFLYLGDRFMREYEENNVLPYGFWNTLPNTGHLNKEGHRMIAEELCKVFEQLEKTRKETAK